MKTLLFVLFFFVSGVAQSQTEYHIYKIRSGPFNEWTQKFDIREKPADIRMVFDRSVVRIFDVARSVYIVRNYTEVKNDYISSVAQWDAVDEKGRSVKIFMSFNKQTDESSLTILYSDFVFEYFFN